jgi:hypothetical protein
MGEREMPSHELPESKAAGVRLPNITTLLGEAKEAASPQRTAAPASPKLTPSQVPPIFPPIHNASRKFKKELFTTPFRGVAGMEDSKSILPKQPVPSNGPAMPGPELPAGDKQLKAPANPNALPPTEGLGARAGHVVKGFGHALVGQFPTAMGHLMPNVAPVRAALVREPSRNLALQDAASSADPMHKHLGTADKWLKVAPGLGALAGAGLGALAPGEDEEGRTKSRLGGAIAGGLAGGMVGVGARGIGRSMVVNPMLKNYIADRGPAYAKGLQRRVEVDRSAKQVAETAQLRKSEEVSRELQGIQKKLDRGETLTVAEQQAVGQPVAKGAKNKNPSGTGPAAAPATTTAPAPAPVPAPADAAPAPAPAAPSPAPAPDAALPAVAAVPATAANAPPAPKAPSLRELAQQTLTKYTNTPDHTAVTGILNNPNASLTDKAFARVAAQRVFNNQTIPGADRHKISISLQNMMRGLPAADHVQVEALTRQLMAHSKV